MLGVSEVTHDSGLLLLDAEQAQPSCVVTLLGQRLTSQQPLDLIRRQSFAVEQERVHPIELLLPVLEGLAVLLSGLVVGHLASLPAVPRGLRSGALSEGAACSKSSETRSGGLRKHQKKSSQNLWKSDGKTVDN